MAGSNLLVAGYEATITHGWATWQHCTPAAMHDGGLCVLVYAVSFALMVCLMLRQQPLL
jgi:hypothetical protein